MQIIDWAVVSGYFALLLVPLVGIRQNRDTTDDYFLTGQNLG